MIKYIDEYNFSQTYFDRGELAKTESIMCLGNGYLGLRSCAEETYPGQRRGLFIAGTFNRFDENEVTELPNCADLVGTDIWFDTDLFDLSQGKADGYEKSLDLKKALLTRKVDWTIKGNTYSLAFGRFVSQSDLHMIGQKISITPKKDTAVRIVMGIDARVTNSGSQHFSEGEKRFIDKKILQMQTQTTQSKINVFYAMGYRVLIDGKETETEPHLILDRRRVMLTLSFELKAFENLQIEKIMDVRTDRDIDHQGNTAEEIKQKTLQNIRNTVSKGYDAALQESEEALDHKLWSEGTVKIESSNRLDQLAVNFARYHLHIMTPAHDGRMNIGAKGLSGEGYKGHTFWDTEIFALPYFILSNPAMARKLVEYRYLTLGGARRKAKENGYEGAQFPWESAWLDDGEVTPLWGPADVVTGLALKIESGLIEQHITSDVAYGVWQYYNATGDERFMQDYGYELIIDTAVFWISRLEFSELDGMLHLNDVMGPDEFKEHVDDNAFTNYMAGWNIKLALQYIHKLKTNNKEIFDRLNSKLHFEQVFHEFTRKAAEIFLPVPGEDSVLPQDNTYLSLRDIDLEKYKNGKYGEIYKDYNSGQIGQIQVSKQADVMLLFLLLEDMFSYEVKEASWRYYEPRTIHDSSLSFSTHAILACDMKNPVLAYSFFERACKIDLGSNMHSCDDGIHAAAMAGIWQSAVFGFAGIRMFNGKLRIVPCLPEAWARCEVVVYWKNQKLDICIDRKKIRVLNITNDAPTEICIVDETVYFDGCGQSAELLFANHSRC